MSERDFTSQAKDVFACAVYRKQRGRSDVTDVIRDALTEAYEEGLENSHALPPEIKALVEAVEGECCKFNFPDEDRPKLWDALTAYRKAFPKKT